MTILTNLAGIARFLRFYCKDNNEKKTNWMHAKQGFWGEFFLQIRRNPWKYENFSGFNRKSYGVVPSFRVCKEKFCENLIISLGFGRKIIWLWPNLAKLNIVCFRKICSLPIGKVPRKKSTYWDNFFPFVIFYEGKTKGRPAMSGIFSATEIVSEKRLWETWDFFLIFGLEFSW